MIFKDLFCIFDHWSLTNKRMKKIYSFIFFLLFTIFCVNLVKAGGCTPPTDTVQWKKFDSLPGYAYMLSYSYSNGSGYFFGTNYLDLDQDPSTPHQNGIPAFAQGFEADTAGYEIIELLFLVGTKIKKSSFGTPLIASIYLLDDSCHYTINTSSGPVEYSIACPGTHLQSASVPWDDINESPIVSFNFTSARLPSAVSVNQKYCVVIDLFDFYMNDDRIGFMCSGHGGASAIFGKENCLWRYPDPLLWLRVDHLYTGMDRALGIFPVIDDGTYGIEEDLFQAGLKLGYAYPNPAGEHVKVVFSNQQIEDMELRILDQSGRTLTEKKLDNVYPGEHELSFDLSGFASGHYYIILSNGKSNLTRKLILAH